MLEKPWQPSSPPRYLARSARSLGDLFLRRVELDGHRVAFKQRLDGRWQPSTWRQFHERSSAVATFLMDRGVVPGDKVCIVGSTRPEWCYGDIGGHLAGAITLGAYSTLTAEQLAYVLGHADAKVAFVEGATEVEKILATRGQLPGLELVCVWDTAGLEQTLAQHEWLVPLADVLRTAPDEKRIAERIEHVDPQSVAIIVYTSGTTGPPKGAMISHSNILHVLADAEKIAPLDADDISLSFLPMAHVAERIVGFYGRLNAGYATCFASSLARVLEEIQEVRPTVFGSVPRIFEKAYARIMAQVEQAPPARQKIFRWAERAGRQAAQRWQRGEAIGLRLRLEYALADRVVFAKIRQAFGGNVRQFITGAAPIAPEILEFFWAVGLPIYEAYGMTEATGLTHTNRRGAVRLGSVGLPIASVEDRLAEDGEVLVRGPTVFPGYYKDPAATAEMIDAEGWLHTGDIGKKDRDGYLSIVDRKKHIIITAGGKNISPANIENEIKAADPLISQAYVHGDRRPYLSALVTIGPAEAVEHARSRGIVGEDEARRILAALTADPLSRPPGLAEVMKQVTAQADVRERVRAAVRRANQRLSRVETIKRVYLLDRELSAADDEITPTLKVKRKIVETRMAPIFDKIYSDDTFGLIVMDKE